MDEPRIERVVSEFKYFSSINDMPENTIRERLEKDSVLRAQQVVSASENEKLKVGASIRSVDGRVVTVPNTRELHAEMHALWELYAQGIVSGGRNKVSMIAIAGEGEGHTDPKMCGQCMSRLMRNTANVAFPNSAVRPHEWEDITVLVLLSDGRVKRTTLNSIHNHEHVHFTGTKQDITWLQKRVKELLSQKAA